MKTFVNVAGRFTSRRVYEALRGLKHEDVRQRGWPLYGRRAYKALRGLWVWWSKE
jgi:hypothetical protein